MCGLLDENGRSIESLLQHSPLFLETDTVKAFSVEKEVHLYFVSWSTSERNSPRNTGINACMKAGSHMYSLQAFFKMAISSPLQKRTNSTMNK